MGTAERRKLRVLVVDDEPLGRARLLELLADEPDVDVVGTAADGGAAIDLIQSIRPDLVFLDVQMPHKSGLDVVRAIGIREMPATVFVTAHEDHAIEAFDAAAVDYLLKPFRDDRFAEALQRARHRIETAEPTRAPRDRIAVQMHGKLTVVQVSTIEYITASGPYAELHIAGRRHVIRETMRDLEDDLDPTQFLRVHRSTIVRLDLVETLIRHEGSEYHVQLKGGVRLRVSRSRREALERRLGRSRPPGVGSSLRR